MVIRKVKYNAVDGCKHGGIKPGSHPSTVKQSKGKPVNTKTGGTGAIITAPPQKPTIEERPYAQQDAIDRVILGTKIWRVLIANGKITLEQIRSIVHKQLH